MLDRLPRTKRNWGLAIVGVLLLWLCWRIREVLNPLVLGYLLAFIVHPAVVRLQARGWSRRRSVNVIFIGAGLVTAVMTVALVVQGVHLTQDLKRAPILDQLDRAGEGLADTLRSWLPEGMLDGEEETEGDVASPADVPETGSTPISSDASSEADPEADPAQGLPEEDLAESPPPGEEAAVPHGEPREVRDQGLLSVLRQVWASLSEEQAAGASSYALRRAGGLWGSARHWFGSVVGLGLLLVLLPVYTYFLLFELGRIHGFVARYIPVRERSRVKRIGGEIGEVIASFFRGRLIVCVLKGLALTIGLALMGVDYALVLGMGSGFLSLVPFVGPMGGFLLAFLLAMTGTDASLLAVGLRIGAVFAIAEVFEGYYLVPKILGETLGLHPVVVLVSVFAGGALLGMFGFLIALPLTAAFVILVKEFVLPALADFADEEESPEVATGVATGEAPGAEPAS